MQRVLREYYEKLYANKLDNLEEMDKFLGTYKLPKLGNRKKENLKTDNQQRNWIVIKKLPPPKKNQVRDQMASEANSTKYFKEELVPILLKLFQKTEKEGKLLNSFYEASITLIPKPDKDTAKRTTGHYILWT